VQIRSNPKDAIARKLPIAATVRRMEAVEQSMITCGRLGLISRPYLN
jgi:hypothetical protein